MFWKLFWPTAVVVATVTMTVPFAHAAEAENFYPMPVADMDQSPDYRAHPRSVEEYRAIVPDRGDLYGMCRNAGHIAQCVWKINGHEYPPTPDFIAFIKKLEKKTK